MRNSPYFFCIDCEIWVPTNQAIRMMKERIERPAPADDIPEETVQAEILVIDDEVLVNNQILKILSRKDCRVEQAVSKNEAIEKIEKWA